MRLVLLALMLLGPLSRAQASPHPAAAPSPPAAIQAYQGDVATFQLVNDSATALPEQVVTFGQMFRPGQVRPAAVLTVTLNGVVASSQMNPKALYPDGSVRHAIIAIRTPPMAGQASLAGVISSLGAPAPPAAPLVRPAPAVELVLTMLKGPDIGKTFDIKLQDLARITAARREGPWLNGRLVREQRYYSAIADGLEAAFDVWTPAVGPSRVDVIVHNDSAQNPSISTQVYDVSLRLDGTPVYQAQRVAHYAYSTWHRQVDAGAARPRIIPDLGLLIAVGAVPRYAQFRPAPVSEQGLHKTATSNARPLGQANITPYMPTTGMRADIGPLPTWAVFYLLDPSRENQETLLANADAAGSIPWHVRDLQTGGPINIDQHPTVWLDGRGQAVPGVLARKYELPATPWYPDDAHQPSLTYLPYLLTGSQYYRDELAMQAGYDLLYVNPDYRGGAAGILLGSQVRGVAWSLRTLANAAFILPADSPLQPYFKAKLDNNLQEIIRLYVKGGALAGAGELQGYLPGPYNPDGAIPPWQQDYLVDVLGWTNSMGFPGARTVVSWMTNFVAGLFTNGERGYPPIYGTPYYLWVVDPTSKRLFSTWRQAFNATFDPVHDPVTMLDSPTWAGGYAGMARAALATIINATGSAQAKQAYAFVKAQTPVMEASYPTFPNFAIALSTPAAQ